MAHKMSALLLAAALGLACGCQSTQSRILLQSESAPIQVSAPQDPAKPEEKPAIGVVDIDVVLKADKRFISDQLEVYDAAREQRRRLLDTFESKAKALRAKQSQHPRLSEEYAKVEEELLALKCSCNLELELSDMDVVADYRANLRTAMGRVAKILNKLAAEQQL